MKQIRKQFFSLQALAGYLVLIMIGTAIPVMASELPIRSIPPKPPAPQNIGPAPTLQKCTGPNRQIAPKETFNLTCNVVSPLGGNKMLILPEMWVPGNGCIVTVDKPRVVMVGNNFGVSATFTNRCGSSFLGSEGGLAWFIYQIQ